MDDIIILVKILVGIAELKNLIGDPLQRQVINEFSYFSITKYFVKYPNISKKKKRFRAINQTFLEIWRLQERSQDFSRGTHNFPNAPHLCPQVPSVLQVT